MEIFFTVREIIVLAFIGNSKKIVFRGTRLRSSWKMEERGG